MPWFYCINEWKWGIPVKPFFFRQEYFFEDLFGLSVFCVRSYLKLLASRSNFYNLTIVISKSSPSENGIFLCKFNIGTGKFCLVMASFIKKKKFTHQLFPIISSQLNTSHREVFYQVERENCIYYDIRIKKHFGIYFWIFTYYYYQRPTNPSVLGVFWPKFLWDRLFTSLIMTLIVSITFVLEISQNCLFNTNLIS